MRKQLLPKDKSTIMQLSSVAVRVRNGTGQKNLTQ